MSKLAPTTVVLLVATVLVGSQMQTATAGPKDKEVLVINGDGQPVPVSGSVAVDGPVSVDGPVQAEQSGRWTVGIEGIPTVTVIDEREPFETRVDASLAATVFSNTASFTVPADTLPVLDHAAPGEVYGINLFRQNNAGGAPGTASLSVFISGYLMPA